MAKDEVKRASGPEFADDIGISRGERGQQSFVNPHALTPNLDQSRCGWRDPIEGGLDVHRMTASEARKVDRHLPVAVGHGAHGAIHAIRKPVVGERDVAAAEGKIGGDSSVMPHDPGAEIDLTSRQEFAPVRGERVGQKRFPMPPDHQPLSLDQDVEIGSRTPAGEAARAPQKRRPGMPLNPLARDPRTIGSKGDREVTDRQGKGFMLEVPPLQPPPHRE